MEIKNKKFFKINIAMFVVLFITVFAIFIYRLVNPTPSLETRACMDRLNSLAIYQSKYKLNNNAYTDKLYNLSRDGKKHFFHKCPLTDEEYTLEVKDSVYRITCKKHKMYIENNILHKD